MAMNKTALEDDQLDNASGGTILPYQVQYGDTLEKIAGIYHVSEDDLKKWNNIQNPSAIVAGQTLVVKF